MATSAELKAHFQTNNRIRDIQIHSAKVHSVAWSSNGNKLASGSFDKTVAIYTIDRERLVCFMHQLTHWVTHWIPSLTNADGVFKTETESRFWM